MFYSHDILQKRGGKFGIIWIAATKGVSLTKRDYCSVCVPKSCDDIVKYITLQAQPSGRKGSRPRFSLYLQSQLMVGVARVFEKQFSYFIVDVHELHKRTSRLTPASFEDIGTANLQLKKNPRSAELCTLPESRLYHDDEFGMMRGSFETSPDPLLLPEIELFSVSPYRAAKLSTSLLQLSPSQMEQLVLESPPHVVSSASEINLKEEEEGARSTDDIEIPGIELPPLEGLQDLLSVMEPEMTEAQPLPGEEEDKEFNLSQITDFGLDQLWELDDQTGQLMLSPPSKGAFPGLHGLRSPSLVAATPPIPDPQTEGAVMDEEEEVEPQQMEEKPPKKKKRDKRDRGLVTPATGPVMQEILRLSPIDAASSPSPLRRRGRKRRLVFADSTTQLSKKDIRHNMATVSNLTRKETIIPLKYLSAKELFDEPARKALKVNPDLLKLWRGRAQLRIAITDPEAEDLDAPAWSIADTRPRPPLPSSTDTTSRDEEEEEDDERARLVKEIPEVLRRDISVSPELLRDVSLETSHPRAKFEDTPQSIIMSDASHLSESKDSSHRKSFHSDTSSHRGSHRPIVDSFKEMEEAIPEELMDMQELPLLPEEDIALELMEGPAVPETEALEGPEAISTSEDEAGKKKTEKKPIPHDNVLRGIGELTAQSDTIFFKDLVPANTFRPIAVKIFSICLEYAAMKLIRVSQKKPYGDIVIRRGPAFA